MRSTHDVGGPACLQDGILTADGQPKSSQADDTHGDLAACVVACVIMRTSLLCRMQPAIHITCFAPCTSNIRVNLCNSCLSPTTWTVVRY